MAKPTSLYIDLEKRTEPMREYGIKGTDVYTSQASPHTLGNVAGFDDLKYATPDYNRYQDLYGLYLGGGFDASQPDFVTPPATPPGGGGGGGGGTPPGTGGGSTPGTDYTGVNPFEDIDTGAGEFDNLGPTVPGATAPPGGGDPGMYYDATPDYSNVTNVGNPFGYGMQRTTKNPRAPGQDGATNTGIVSLTGANPGAGRIWPDRSTTPNTTYDPMNPPMLGDEGGSMDYMSGSLDAPYGVHPETGVPYQTPRSISDQNAVLGRTFEQQKDPAQWEALRDKFVQTGQDVGNFFTDLKDKGMDLGRMAGTTLLNLAGTALTGVPLLGTAINLIGGALPKRDPRQTALDELYDIKDGTIQSGLMKGYNPVSGGGLYTLTGGARGEPPTYGLQKAYDKRINTIENTLANKYGMTAADIADVRAGSYTGDVDTNLLKTLTDLDEAKAAEKGRLDLFSGDVDDRDQMLDDYMLQNKIDAGIQAADDDSGSEMLEEDDLMGYDEHYDMVEPTTPTGIIKPATNRWNTFPPDYITEGVTDKELYGDTSTLPKGPPGILNPYEQKTLADTDWQTMGDEFNIDISQDAETRESASELEERINRELVAQKTKTDRIKREQDIARAALDREVEEEMNALRKEAAEQRADEQRAEVARQNEIRRQAEIDKLAAARREAARRNQGGGNGGGQGDRSGGRSSSSGESDYGGFCFDPNTRVQMADGSEKRIKEIQLGDNTKGGEVTGVFQFKATDEIHDYKGVTVAGSHYVKEDGKFIMVQDSPISVKIDKIPVVYSLDTTGRRIFIKDIEFADYNGDGIAKGFLHNAGLELNGFNKEVLRQVENRLI